MIIVVPARGGSQRVPLKNIYSLAGKPLLSYTLAAIEAAGLREAAVVSTDSDPIAEVALEQGFQVIKRPPEFATSSASTESVLLHVLETQSNAHPNVEWIMTLPPTSPFRSAETIRRFKDEADKAKSDVDCIFSVTENRGDFWRSHPDGTMQRLFPNAPRRQQDREPLFEENSAVYVTRAARLRETGSILGRKVHGVVIDTFEAFDINTSYDILVAEALLAGRRT